MILANHGIISSSGGALTYDADALAFITAASITDNTQKTAINTLVTDLKNSNIWTKMKAIYPLVGGTAFSHKWNLKDPRDINAAYRMLILGGWTHDANGMTANATNSYVDTLIKPSLAFSSNNSIHVAAYSRTNSSLIKCDFGTENPGGVGMIILYSANTSSYMRVNRLYSDSISISTITNTSGFLAINRISSTQEDFFRNTTKTSFNKTATARADAPIYFGAYNQSGIPNQYTDKNYSFFSVSEGLTDSEHTALYNAVQACQVTLGRSI